MRRIVWVAVGAAGGIYAYRRAQQLLADARERGVVVSAQQAGVGAATALAAARGLVATASTLTVASPRPAGASPASTTPGSAAARVLASTRRTATTTEAGHGLR